MTGEAGLALGRSIAWLRADSEALTVLREVRSLLARQGVRIFQPRELGEVVADVIVEPLPGSPEWLVYRSLPRRSTYTIVERDPWRALSLALTAPRRSFERLTVGVDPGRLCAASIVADNLLLRSWKTPCHRLGEEIGGLIGRIPAAEREVVLGSGPGVEEAASSLVAGGITFLVADESWTTSRPALWGILGSLGDRDLVASATIALMGARRRLDQ